jgi:hypothetical protein
MHVHPETLDAAAAVDDILGKSRGGTVQSIETVIAQVKARTATERSDADLSGLIMKKAAALGVTLSAGHPPNVRPPIGLSSVYLAKRR